MRHPEFSELVAEYELDSRARNKSSATIKGQNYALSLLGEWIEASGASPDPRDWTWQTMRAFIIWLQRRPARYGGQLSPVTVNTVVRMVRTFCNWMRESGYVDTGLFDRRGIIPRMPQQEKAALTHAEFNRILAAARQTRHDLRNEAILLFMLDTGVRARELLNMRFEDVDILERTAKVRGKGDKDRILVFSLTTAKALQRYANAERYSGPTFFTSERIDTPLSYTGLCTLFLKLSEATGIHVHAHKLRHTSATWLAADGANAFEIQQQLGHSSMAISLRYVHLNDGNRRQTIDKHSPAEQARGRRERR